MSRRGTQYLRRRRQYGRVADVGWAVTFAACATEADLDAARRVSHDRLIEMTGRHRRGGVMWTWKAATEAEAWLRTSTGAERWREYQRRSENWLAVLSGTAPDPQALGSLVLGEMEGVR